MAEDKLEKGWCSPIATTMFALTSEQVRANSIVYVPERLEKSNEKAYKPKVVSIGPVRRKSSRDLLYMDEIKWQCMLSLLHRINPTDDDPNRVPQEHLNHCGEVILKYDEAVRACYMDPIELDSHKLAQIMLLDGCFLLELLLDTNGKQLNGEPESKIPVKVQKKEEFLSDLKLLENQIPLFIIDLLYLKLFGKKWEEQKKKEIPNIVNGYALFLFGCSSGRPIESPKRAHFLELTHWFLTSRQIGAKPERSAPETVVEIPIDPPDHEHMEIMGIWLRERNERDKKTTPKLERCAARLQAAGVKIETFYGKKSSSELKKDLVMFGCNAKFGQGVLEIQSLCVTEETELQWRNFIAWEQTRSAEKTWDQTTCGQTRTTEKKFSQYALLFKGLVCCEYDIELLKSAKVLKVHDENKWSNEKVNKFIHDIADGIQIDANADPKFCEMINDLNGFNEGCCRFIMSKHCCRVLLTKARKFCRYLYGLLQREYGCAAGMLLFLTMTQTVFAAIALYVQLPVN